MNRYLVVLHRRPTVVPEVVAAHLTYLEGIREQGLLELSGGFSDKSGGAYILRAESMADAQALVDRDPAKTSGSWDITVSEWNAK